MDPSRITLRGRGHWAVCKSATILESNLWVWWVEIEGVTTQDGEYLIPDELLLDHAVERMRATKFMKKVGPTLPLDAASRIEPPIHTPGDDAKLSIPLRDFLDPGKALAICEEFFPAIFKLTVA